MEVKDKTASKVWKKALKYILSKGKDFTDKEERVCREILNMTLVIEDPTKDITGPIKILNSFKKWIYPPLEELAKFMLSKKDMPGYYYTYGSRAFNFGSGSHNLDKKDQNQINQIEEFVIPLLKKDPTSRRATVLFYNPLKDSNLYKKEVPGMILANFKIKDKKLYVTAVIRSNDLFYGWPTSIYQIYILQDYIREKLNLDIGSITTFSVSAHIFEDQFDDIKKIIG